MVVIGLAKLKALRPSQYFAEARSKWYDILVQDSCDDSENSQKERNHNQHSALSWKSCEKHHLDWNGDEQTVRGNVEDHLNDRVVLVS